MLRVQNVCVMKHNCIEVAIIDYLATGGATVEIALLLRRQIFELLLFHSKYALAANGVGGLLFSMRDYSLFFHPCPIRAAFQYRFAKTG